MADALPWLIVSPDGVLHVLPNVKRTKIAFCKAHGLRDKKYLESHLAGKQLETYGWQLLDKVKCLKHVASGRVVLVVGKATIFLADHATSRGHRYGSNCAQPQSTVMRPSNPLPCHNLPRQRRLIPSSLALCLPDFCTLLNLTPEASLWPVPTLSGLPFASRSSVAGSGCVPVLSLQTLAAADLLYAVPLLLGRLQGDEASAAGVLGPLSMRVHGKRDVQRPRGLSGDSLSFRELPERRSKHPRGSPHPPHRYSQTAGEHDGRPWRRMAHDRATGGCRVAARGSVARSAYGISMYILGIPSYYERSPVSIVCSLSK